jgi:hypothetical protein
MQASIQLVRFQADPNALDVQHAYPITIQAYGTDIPSEVFVYRVGKSGDPFKGDQFSCVASVSQIYEIPADRALALTSENQISFYRTSQLELICRTSEEAEYVWAVVQEDILALVNNYNLSFNLKGNVTVTISGDSI